VPLNHLNLTFSSKGRMLSLYWFHFDAWLLLQILDIYEAFSHFYLPDILLTKTSGFRLSFIAHDGFVFSDPSQYLTSRAEQESDTNYTHDVGNSGTKPKENISSQRVSSGSFNGLSDKKLVGRQTTTRRASYGRLAVAWWQEILSFLFAAALFVANAIILAKYNGQEQTDWKYSLNLSTLVAVLSTLLRASMAVVVE
jgi:hypothetical protein